MDANAKNAYIDQAIAKWQGTPISSNAAKKLIGDAMSDAYMQGFGDGYKHYGDLVIERVNKGATNDQEMTVGAIKEVVEAQAELQTAIGWHRLENGDNATAKRMYKALNRLHDLLKENDVIMGRHMDQALKDRGIIQEGFTPQPSISTHDVKPKLVIHRRQGNSDYRAECSCGWHGPMVSFRMAANDARTHMDQA